MTDMHYSLYFTPLRMYKSTTARAQDAISISTFNIVHSNTQYNQYSPIVIQYKHSIQ